MKERGKNKGQRGERREKNPEKFAVLKKKSEKSRAGTTSRPLWLLCLVCPRPTLATASSHAGSDPATCPARETSSQHTLSWELGVPQMLSGSCLGLGSEVKGKEESSVVP